MWGKKAEEKAKNIALGVAQVVLYGSKNVDGQLIEAYKQKDFDQICRDANLNMDESFQYVYWPSFFDKESSLDKKIINVCTVCFGALSLIRGYEMGLYSEENSLAVKRTINAAVNTLIFLRGSEGEWPPHWEIGKARMSNAGSMNQTALCLTVLMRTGFFDEKTIYSDETISESERKARIQILLHSIDWIMKAQSREAPKYGWDYAKNKSGTLSTMATANVIDLLTKVCVLIKSDNVILEMFQNYRGGLLDEINETISYLMPYYEGVQNSDGGYSKIYKEGNSTKSSMLHTLYGINVLLTREKINVNKVEKALEYVFSHYHSGDWSLKHEEECFEQYSYTALAPFVADTGEIKYMENYIDEKFEIFPCSLVITTLCNIYNKIPGLHNEKRLKRIIEEQWIQIQDRAMKTDEGGCIIRGNRRIVGANYPMYILYYTLLSYKYMSESGMEFSLAKKVNNDKAKIALMAIACAVLAIISGVIGGWSSFFVWILTGVCATIAPRVIEKIKR